MARLALPRHYHVLPVLFLEFLAIAVTKSLVPELMVRFFGDRVYLVIGVVEQVKGVLAFFACPLFGKLSDAVGRKRCLFVTVLGTTLPVCTLALTRNLWVYVVAQGLSGMFSSTFTLTFAYISDIVAKEDRAPAYGLALATFGLSFSIGPVVGGVIGARRGDRAVFVAATLLSLADLAYIALMLPESRDARLLAASGAGGGAPCGGGLARATTRREREKARRWHPNQFNPLDTLQIFRGDILLRRVALVVLCYYTGVWAVIATMVVYAVRVFGMTKIETGYLLSAFGLMTMFSESVLVRVFVPRYGERATMRAGLLCFALQTAILAVAKTPRAVFWSTLLSLGSNLVYPSVSSLVSRSVPPEMQGEAQGAVNGVKAVTEGIGPLAFSFLLALFERTAMPGAPYLVASAVVLVALALSFQLPSEDEYSAWRALTATRDDPLETRGLLEDDDDDDDAADRDDDDAPSLERRSPLAGSRLAA